MEPSGEEQVEGKLKKENVKQNAKKWMAGRQGIIINTRFQE